MIEEDKTPVEKVLASHDALAAETEKKIVSSAIPANQPKQPINKTAFRYTGIDDLEDIIKFQYPKATFLVAVDLDKMDGNGYPTVTRRKLREASIRTQSMNTYIRGRCTGSQFTGVAIEFHEALCLIKQEEVSVHLSTFKSAGE